jgi:hypothetical protein
MGTLPTSSSSPTAARLAQAPPSAVVYLNLNPRASSRLAEEELTACCTDYAAWLGIRVEDIVVDESPLPATQRKGWPKAAVALMSGEAQRLITWEQDMLGADRPSAQEVAEELRVAGVTIHEVADVEHQLPSRSPGTSLSSPKWRLLGQHAPRLASSSGSCPHAR